ncbi:MAG: ArsR family transcriptional regulator [Neomegalonema sp.]|nr:ArsR family transcriptional regulator [Neomegalonema sp.]
MSAFASLAHPKRLEAFRLIVASGPDGMSSGALARKMGLRPSTMSVNLVHLTKAGLVLSSRAGKEVLYRADLDGARDLIGFLFVDCCGGHPEACGPWLSKLAPRCEPLE